MGGRRGWRSLKTFHPLFERVLSSKTVSHSLLVSLQTAKFSWFICFSNSWLTNFTNVTFFKERKQLFSRFLLSGRLYSVTLINFPLCWCNIDYTLHPPPTPHPPSPLCDNRPSERIIALNPLTLLPLLNNTPWIRSSAGCSALLEIG